MKGRYIPYPFVSQLEKQIKAIEDWFKNHDESHQYWFENKKTYNEKTEQLEYYKTTTNGR